jgi:hypothetical protein
MSISLQQTPEPSRLAFSVVSKYSLEDETKGAYLAVDPGCDKALGIAVSGTDTGTSGVQLGTTTVRPHLRQVQRTVHTAGEL